MSKFKRNKASLATCLNNISSQVNLGLANCLMRTRRLAEMKLTLSRIVTASYGDELKPKPNIPNGEDQGVGLIAGAHDCHLLHVPPVHF